MDPNVRQAVPLFQVADMQRSVRYYVDGLGFEITLRWTVEERLRWCWLENGGAAVMLEEDQARSNPEAKMGAGVSIYFICHDAVAIYREVTARGIAAERPFVGNRMWVTGLTDPDGYRLYFESPTNDPEETQLPD